MSTARAWFEYSRGGDGGGACAEVAAHPAAVHVRDSRNPEGPALALPPAAWTAFTACVGR
ncbi:MULTISPECIES: DUF397 domain-containing protein [Streptomyces]|uniref:DUF397 domain-containing protein n=1 Tax=Streptomyces TaxID=1883 RepID=UPI0021A4D884|nr:DUF397 domain-containing protein [Streptomyces atratus]MCT2545940.1 DUF397 domain-containing protein [Streptomyces atratus]